MLTYAELFAGAGGMSLGLEAAGWHCVAHAEIEPHARAVLRYRWPDTQLLGDVAQIDGRQFNGITMLTGGSPCQDLSIAGRRAGMQDGTRSSLFFEQVRIWRESEAPLLLWENVVGAFSSNHGRDFASVLESIVGSTVDVPTRGGKPGWSRAGRVSGVAGVAIWRTLDLQYFATPQRRRRVFVLGVRAGAYGAGQLQALVDGLLGDSSAGGEAREGATPDAGRCAQGEVRAFASSSLAAYSETTVGGSLRAAGGDLQGGSETLVIQPPDAGRGVAGGSDALTFEPRYYTRDNKTAGAPSSVVTLTASVAKAGDAVPHVLTYDARGNGDGDVVNTLAGDHANRVTDYTPIVLRQREGKPGGGKGPLLSEGQRLTLGTSNDQVVFTMASGQANAEIVSNGAPSLTALHEQPIAFGVGVPRRLMPIETERLQGWPDQHTAHGIDEQGREYALKDTPRYKLCGNGIGSPVTAWLGWQIRIAVDTPP